MLRHGFVLFLSLLICLSGCHGPVYNQTESNVADTLMSTNAAFAKSDADAKTPPSLLVKKGLYVDTTPIDLNHQPSWLQNKIIIRGDQLPFSYYTRTVASGANQNVLTDYQNGLDATTPVSINYSGNVKGALDLLASKTGFTYKIEKNAIHWQAFVTKTFDIAFMPGGVDYSMGNTGSESSSGGGSGGSASSGNYVSSDSSSSEFSSLKGTLSVWKDLASSIKQVLSPKGNIIVSESTTSVTVTDYAANIALAQKYIENLNINLSKQVLVKVQLIDVQLSNDYNYGIDWQIVANAFHNSPFVINGNYGTPISISKIFSAQSVLPATLLENGTSIPASAVAPMYPQMGTISNPGNGLPSWTILLNALSQQGKTSVVSEPRVLCLNNQVSVVRVVTQKGYLASLQNTTTPGATGAQSTVTSQITPGTLITGLTLYILPKILNDKVYMQINADISTDIGFGTISSGGSTIQLPNITEKHFNQRSMIQSGDTLILSGFKQASNQANSNQFLSSQALGGSGSQMLKNETIVLITPIILNGNA